MSDHSKDPRTKTQLLKEVEELRFRLEEAEQTLEAIRNADVDALVVAGPQGEQVFSITGAEHIYRVIVETMNEAALTVDPDGTILFCNQRFCDLMKTPIQGAMGRKMAAFVAWPQQVPLKTFLAEAQAGPVQRRLTLRATDGVAVPVQLAAGPLQAGDSTSICLVASDLSELEASAKSIRVLREHQQALQESEARFRTMLEASQDAIVITDDEGIYVQANPAVTAIFGLPPERLLGHKTSEFLDGALDFPAFWRAFLTTGSFHDELGLIDAQGQQRDVDFYAVTNILPGRHMAVVRDITERKQVQRDLEDMNERLQSQAEELAEQTEELRAQTKELAAANAALRQSEERLRLAQQAGRVGVFDRDLPNNTVVWTPELEELFGLPAGTFVGKPEDWAKWVHPEDLPRMRSFLQEWIQSERTEEAWEYRFIRADGQVRWMEGRGRIFRDPNGKPLRMVGTNTDITERKQAEEALRESEERFRTLADNISQFAWMTDETGWIFWYNKRWYEYTGTTFEEMEGWGWQKVHHPDHVERVTEKFRHHVQTGEIWEDTFPLQGKDSQYRWFLSRAIPIRDESGKVVRWFGTNTDVTEQRNAQEALQELTKTLESKVGQRTAELQYRARQLQRLTLELSETEDRERRQLAEILHDDLQQQLAAAKFHLSLLNNRAKYDPAQQAIVAQVDQILIEAIQKSRSLSHELSPAVLYHGDFAGALDWLADQVRAKHGLEVAVDAFGDVNIESEALKSFLYKAAQEMLFNVVKHARIDKARIRVRRFGRCICLSVSDRGRGFDPQEVRQTTGFGLLSIRERVELLGGRMKMHSIKGQGSTFHVVVPDGPLIEDGYPSLENLGRTRNGVLVPGAASAQPKLRVLLADDHEIVREGLISLLSDVRDIEVVGEAANGREAVNQAYRLQPDVVIMDVAMPLINGDDATRQIKLHLPKTRVIALSMYEEPDMVEKMRRAGAEAYILKTAPSEELVATIRGKVHAGVTA